MTNRVILVLAFAIASAGQLVHAAPATGYNGTEALGITAVGHADIVVKPDIAYLSVGVVTQDSNQSNAVSLNATKTRAVIDSLHKSGIADKDIQTDNYYVQTQYDYHPSPPVLTGYQVTNSLRVTIRDLSQAGTVSDNAVDAGANQVNGLSFDIADKAKVEAQTLATAIADGRLKAHIAAAAAGVGLGRLLNLSEGTVPSVQPIRFGGANGAMMRAAAAPTPIESNQIHVTADVSMLYAIDYSGH